MIRKPDFLIVGAPKCGTTALDHFLGSHPDIFTARKEMHHFGSDLRFGPQFYRRDQAAYLDEFSGARDKVCAGEASVWYLASHTAAQEIKDFNSQARIIIMLREPSEMMYSLYCQFIWDGNEHLPSFAQALEAEPYRLAGERLSSQTYLAQGLCYRHNARYAQQVKRYLEIFGRENVHVIIYDDLLADPAAVKRGVLEFLGVDAHDCEPELQEVNAAKVVKNPYIRAIQNSAHLRKVVLGCRPFIPSSLFGLLQKLDARVRKLNSIRRQRQPMAPELRQQLRREFAPEVERLSQLLGRDLSFWSHGAGEPAPRPAGKSITTLLPRPVVATGTAPALGSLPRS